MDFPHWVKSSYSSGHGECVELAALGGDRFGIRNSNRPGDGVLVVTRAQLAALLSVAKSGDLDHLA